MTEEKIKKKIIKTYNSMSMLVLTHPNIYSLTALLHTFR
jgi:hypothetical protein